MQTFTLEEFQTKLEGEWGMEIGPMIFEFANSGMNMGLAINYLETSNYGEFTSIPPDHQDFDSRITKTGIDDLIDMYWDATDQVTIIY